MEISSDENFQNNMLAQLYNAYENKMYGIAYSILNNVEQSEDAVHDAFIKLIPHLSAIQRIESIKTKRLVVYTIKNIAIDLYRRNRKETQLFTKGVEEKVTSENQNGVPCVKTVEDRHMITQLLSKLPSKYREIIQYRCFYELSYREISSLLNISEDVAAKRYERARKMVKEMMGDELYG
ncbi:sigma-70 family RNA polymerase sigma factor [Clostridium sp.]|uniref:RNA polymerase sigma factor n=1 Tax=Clostridium sp. TaxID=1506 RepID=UPI003216A316